MSKHILIVDDDPELVEAISTLLEAKGYQVDTAPNGREGFAKAHENPPDLMFLDVMMATKTEGFDIARLLKSDEATKDIPVVMLTGIRKDMNLPFRFEPDADWLPVKTVLEKPVKPEVLLKTVETYIRK